MYPTLLLILITLLTHTASGATWSDRPLSELETRRKAIYSQLSKLADYSLASGIGPIGYRSSTHEQAENREWIQIEFGITAPLDEVILVPAIHLDARKRFQPDAFPDAFRLVAGTDDNTEGIVIASFDHTDTSAVGIAPFIIPCHGIEASWIRIETEKLSLRAFDNSYVLQLSEIMAFSGPRNVALKKTVTCFSKQFDQSVAWKKSFIVDGFVPYLMDAAHGMQSVAYLSPAKTIRLPALTVDLQKTQEITSIQLHTVGSNDTRPQAFANDYGIPKNLLVQGANNADFSDAVELLDLYFNTIYDISSIMTWQIPPTNCRYVRFSVIEPSQNTRYGAPSTRFGFSEIELFSHGKNIAYGKPVTPNFSETTIYRHLHNLTDGRNMFGDILPMRIWLNQLSLRHALETERPPIIRELTRRYARQKTNLNFMIWIAVLLAAASIITILVNRIIRQRELFQTRERIAANLHDELGANIHAIGLLGDLALQSKAAPEKLERLLHKLRSLTERTGLTARYCTNMLEAPDLYEDPVDNLRKTAERIIADLSHTIQPDGEEFLLKLTPRNRIDLLLFYKECLINIIRHSGATQVRTQLRADNKQIQLIVADNGQGLGSEIPRSLKRRARFLKANVISSPPESGGTQIILNLKLGRTGARK